MAETDEELREKGRQRAVTNLAAEAHREKGRRSERLGSTIGSLGGLAAGASIGKGFTQRALGGGLGYLAGGKLGKTIGEEMDIKKNASIIDLIRKTAASAEEVAGSPTREDQVKSFDRRIDKTRGEVIKQRLPGGLVGAAAGGVGGGYLGHLGAQALGDRSGYITTLGALGGASLGANLGILTQGNRGREMTNKLEGLEGERRALIATKPGLEDQGLTDETLDRDRAAKLDSQLAAGRLKLREGVAPLSRGAAIGLAAGAGLGGLLGRRYGGGIDDTAGGAMLGGAIGSMGGLMAATPFVDEAGVNRDFKRHLKLNDEKRDIWQAASEMGKTSSARVAAIRKTAHAVAFKELTEPEPSTDEVLLEMKIAAVEDESLFMTACAVSTDMDDSFATYEALGGTYKVAFGTPMFNTKQMAGSPSLSLGTQNRNTAATRQAMMPQPVQQPQPAQQQPRAAAPRQTNTQQPTVQQPRMGAAPTAGAPTAPSVSQPGATMTGTV